MIVQPVYQAAPQAPAPQPAPEKKPAANPTQGSVEVRLPGDARMYVDGQLAPLTSTVRRFETPQLQLGRDYYYTIKAEAVRNGQMVTESKKVVVRAGQVARVDFGELTVAAASKTEEPSTARITIRLPEDARLFINGTACPLTSGTRAFDTPVLDRGREYAYTLKAELVRDGQTYTETQQVKFVAGKQVDVRFGAIAPVATAQR